MKSLSVLAISDHPSHCHTCGFGGFRPGAVCNNAPVLIKEDKTFVAIRPVGTPVLQALQELLLPHLDRYQVHLLHASDIYILYHASGITYI